MRCRRKLAGSWPGAPSADRGRGGRGGGCGVDRASRRGGRRNSPWTADERPRGRQAAPPAVEPAGRAAEAAGRHPVAAPGELPGFGAPGALCGRALSHTLHPPHGCPALDALLSGQLGHPAQGTQFLYVQLVVRCRITSSPSAPAPCFLFLPSFPPASHSFRSSERDVSECGHGSSSPDHLETMRYPIILHLDIYVWQTSRNCCLPAAQVAIRHLICRT